MSWWCHQMETFSALLAICAGNSLVNGEFPAQRPVTRSFDVFFDLRLNKTLSKQWPGSWFEMPSCPSWPHCNVCHVSVRAVQILIFYTAFQIDHGRIKWFISLAELSPCTKSTDSSGAVNLYAKFMGPTWGPPGSCRPHMGPMLAPWTLLSGYPKKLTITHACLVITVSADGLEPFAIRISVDTSSYAASTCKFDFPLRENNDKCFFTKAQYYEIWSSRKLWHSLRSKKKHSQIYSLTKESVFWSSWFHWNMSLMHKGPIDYNLSPVQVIEAPSHYLNQWWPGLLTHWGRDKMANISQATLWNAFSWIKIYEFQLIFYIKGCSLGWN